MRQTADQQASNLAYKRVVIAVMTGIALDSVWALLNSSPKESWRFISYISDSVYLVVVGLVSCLWLIFIETKLGYATRKPGYRRFRPSIFMPMSLLVILSFISPWTGTLYFLDANNKFQYGPYYVIILIISIFYLTYASVEVLMNTTRGNPVKSREESLTLLTFFALPTLGGLINEFFMYIPATWPLCALSLLIIYENFQNFQISTDGLTGINNRRQFDRYMGTLTDASRHGQIYYLFMMDIDSFKMINDVYGHYEGDNALRETAEILKQVCRNYNAFLARYGGDEFVILVSFLEDAQSELLREEIKTLFAQRNQETSKRYAIRLSVGVERFRAGSEMSISEVIRGADKALYEEKERSHQSIDKSFAD